MSSHTFYPLPDVAPIAFDMNLLWDALAREFHSAGGVLRCMSPTHPRKSPRERALGSREDVRGYLQEGWPYCHGGPMRWLTRRQLDEERASA